MSTRTQYDVDTHGCERVLAPFRVRNELRHAPPAHPEYGGWREPIACTSDSVELEDYRRTTVVARPINADSQGASK